MGIRAAHAPLVKGKILPSGEKCRRRRQRGGRPCRRRRLGDSVPHIAPLYGCGVNLRREQAPALRQTLKNCHSEERSGEESLSYMGILRSAQNDTVIFEKVF